MIVFYPEPSGLEDNPDNLVKSCEEVGGVQAVYLNASLTYYFVRSTMSPSLNAVPLANRASA